MSGSSPASPRALLGEPVDHLLGEQRVAAGALGHLGRELVAAPPSRRAARATSSRVSLGGERLERDRGRVAAPAAPAGPPLEQLVAGQADQQQRPADPPRQVLDQVEHALVGPVDVLEREHQRRRARPIASISARTARRAPRASAAGPRRRRAASSSRRLDAERAARSAPRGARPARRSRRARAISASTPRAELLPGGARRRRCRRSRTRRGSPRRAPSRRCRAVGQAAAARGSAGASRARRACASSSRSRRDLPTPPGRSR